MGKLDQGLEKAAKVSSDQQPEEKLEDGEWTKEKSDMQDMELSLKRVDEMIESLKTTKEQLEASIEKGETPPNWGDVHHIIENGYEYGVSTLEKRVQGYVPKKGRSGGWEMPDNAK